jgi:hypothetical protein
LIQRLGHRRKAVLAAFQAEVAREPEQEGQQTFLTQIANQFYLNYLPTDFNEHQPICCSTFNQHYSDFKNLKYRRNIDSNFPNF